MFLISAEPSLKETIIRLLAKKSSLSGSTLRLMLTKLIKRSFTKQAVYKELRKLESAGIVVRDMDGYSLKLSWVISVVELSEQLSQNYFCEKHLKKFLPAPQKKLNWTFSSLGKTDLFWTQLVSNIFKLNPESICYLWAPHPWWYLVHPRIDQQLLISLQKINARFYHLFSEDNYLVKQYIHFGKATPIITTKISSNFLPDYQKCYLDINGDYITTIKPDKHFSDKIENYFAKIKNRCELEQNPPYALTHSKGKIRLTIENNAKKATALKLDYLEIYNSAKSIL